MFFRFVLRWRHERAAGSLVVAAPTGKAAPQVEQAGTFSQNMDRHTLHTKPSAVGRLWQKQEARKSTPAARGRRRNSLDAASAV